MNNPQVLSWDDRVSELFACPACEGGLRVESGAAPHISCANCGRMYPIEDGIPVLIAERATLPT